MLESAPDLAKDLAHKILQYKAWAGEAVGEKQPYCWAGWTLIREDEALDSVEKVCAVTDGASNIGDVGSSAGSAAAAAGAAGACSAPNLLAILLWAQQNAYSLRATNADPKKRSALLLALLSRLSADPGVGDADRGKLWSGQFAKLLSVPAAPAGGDDAPPAGLDGPTFRKVLLSRGEAEAEWESPIPEFFDLLHSRGDPAVANELWGAPPSRFPRFLFREGDAEGAKLDAAVVRGLLNVVGGGSLDTEIQKELLTGGVTVGGDVLPGAFTKSVADALKEVFADAVDIRGANGPFVEAVKAAARQRGA